MNCCVGIVYPSSLSGNAGGAVDSVFGRTGDVIAQSGDYTAAQVGAVALVGDESISGIKSFVSYPEGPGTSPTTGSQLVDKAYVDLLVTTGARFVDAVLAATAAPLPANTYNNGALGVGATLTGNANGALAAIDGITPVLNGKYLIKDEAAQENNGAYILTQVGDTGNPYILTRLSDYNESAEIVAGTFFTVLNGTVNDNQQWAMHNPATIVVGTTAIEFAQLSTMPTITASLGVQKVGNDVRSNLNAAGAITLSGNAIGVAVDNSTININANAIRVAPLGITNAQVSATAGIVDTKLATITTAGKVRGSALTILSGIPGAAGLIPVANGSTGNSSYGIGDLLYASAPGVLSKLGVGSTGQILGISGGLPAWIANPGGGSSGVNTINYSKSLNTDPNPVAVSNTVTETTIYSFSITANTLGTDKILQGVIQGTYLNNSAATRTVRVRIKYGATTILDKTSAAIGFNAAPGTFFINYFIGNQGSASVQEAYMNCSIESGANVSVNWDDRGVAAINSATTQTLVVTVQMSAATATQTITKTLGVLNMLNATDSFGAINIGEPVGGGTADQILYTDNSGNVISDSQFTRDSVSHQTLQAVDIPAAYAADNNLPNPFSVVADTAGNSGNAISLTFDGIDDVTTVVAAWNGANPSNTTTIISGGASVPDASTVTLKGGGTTSFELGEVSSGTVKGAGFRTQDTTNDVTTFFASGNLSFFTGAPHGQAFFVQDQGGANDSITALTQSASANNLVAIDLAAFSYFASASTSSQSAYLRFIDATSDSGFFAEPANKTYIQVNSNQFILPTTGGSPDDVLAIDTQIGSEYQLKWLTVSGGGSAAGSTYEIQLNAGASVFGATSNFSYNTATNLIKLVSTNGLSIDPANDIYRFGNLGVNNSTSNFTHSDVTNFMDYTGGVPVFGAISAVISGGPNDLSYSGAGYTSRSNKTWDLEVDSVAIKSGTIFTGVGLNDGAFSGTFGGSTNELITVSIDSTGGTDTFEWFLNGVSQATGVAITGAAQALSNGISITFGAVTGHTSGDDWSVGNGFGAIDFAATSFIGTFVYNETVTGSISGQTATLGYASVGSSQVILTNISSTGFVVGDVLTGGTSGAVATITGLTSINDTFDWTNDGGTTPHPQTPITAVNAPYELSDGVTVQWPTKAGHGVGTTWSFSATFTNIIKQRFSNLVSDNSVEIGDVGNVLASTVANYFKMNLGTNITKISGNQIGIGDVDSSQNSTGINISDSLQTIVAYAPSLFRVGDINTLNSGMQLHVSSIENKTKIESGASDQYFLLDVTNQLYKFGDISATGSANSLRIDDAGNSIRLGNGTNDIIINNNDSTTTLSNGFNQSKVTVVTYNTTTNLTLSDYDLEIDGGSGIAYVNLPTGTNAPVGTMYVISDLGCDCSNSNIVLDAGGGNTIAAGTAAQQYTMSTDGQVVVLKKVTASKWKVQ
jgi:hypothetical protein